VIAHDIDTGDNLWYVERAHAGGVTALQLSHNMRFLLTGGTNGEVRLWELRSREMISHMKEHTQRITDIRILSDDMSALTSSRDRCIMHWDLREEVSEAPCPAQPFPLRALIFLPQRRLYCYTQRMGGINTIALSKDETQIISMGQERKISFWNRNSPAPIHESALGEHEEGTCLTR
jgi:cilia- and flagella-associated protein 52